METGGKGKPALGTLRHGKRPQRSEQSSCQSCTKSSRASHPMGCLRPTRKCAAARRLAWKSQSAKKAGRKKRRIKYPVSDGGASGCVGVSPALFWGLFWGEKVRTDPNANANKERADQHYGLNRWRQPEPCNA